MNKKHAITVSNLVKKYKKADTPAVNDVSFKVKDGEFFAFLGPNGAGKTTTISILTTTLSKTSGSVTIAGYDIDKQASNVRANIGVIFQNPSLDLNLTAEENIRFHAVLYGMYNFMPAFNLMDEAYKKRVNKLASVLGIEKELHNSVKSFSGGMKRKLEIVRSLMHSPKVLFLDEPTSGLDPASRKSLWKYLLEVKEKNNTTIFLTTHYLEEAEDADQIVIIDNGKIADQGTPSKIKSKLIRNYLQINSKKMSKLESEIKKLKLDYKKANNHYEVDLNDSHPQKIISKIKTPLDMLKIHTPTLEEAYLNLVERSEDELH